MNHEDQINTNESHFGTNTPAELFAIANAADRLGRSLSKSAPSGLEDRVFERTRTMLSANILSLAGGSESRAGSRGWMTDRSGLRIAAAIAAVSSIVIAGYFALSGMPKGGTPNIVATSNGLEAMGEELDFALAAVDLWDDPLVHELRSIGTRIDSLRSEADPWWDDPLLSIEESL